MESFKQAEDFGVKKGSKMFAVALRAILGLGKEKIRTKTAVFEQFRFLRKTNFGNIKAEPTILGLSEEKLKRNVDFLVNSVGLPLDDLVKYPNLFHSAWRRG
jgi:mTERF domain-containing protein